MKKQGEIEYLQVDPQEADPQAVASHEAGSHEADPLKAGSQEASSQEADPLKASSQAVDKTSSSYLALFLHGYGANAQDLSSFQSLSAHCRWVFPNGLVKLEAPYSDFGGRAWFPLKINDSNNQLLPDENSIYYFEKSLRQMLDFVKSFNMRADKIILGGFSQGAIMALNMALRMKPPPRALVFMSGALFPALILEKEKPSFSNAGLFFQCHGTSDPLLPYSASKEVFRFLKDLKWQGSFLSFEGGHEIPPIVLENIQKFIHHQILKPS